MSVFADMTDRQQPSVESNVVHLSSLRHASPPPAQTASERVAEAIRAEVTASILAQACARAARAVSVLHLSVDDAVRMATAWALDPSRTDPTPPARAA